ncbi:hypothetical protein ACFS5N_12945 [Mucilaginibacter ximonensis]|uniref:DUF1700 domain-containing protein n=1 Tax=Mucilaginibacter ximonensis TaxID=538021 RepID=A0ABW5YDN6_9SPHI
MKTQSDGKDRIEHLRTAAEKQNAIEEKLDELINLLAENDFDSETVKQYQHKLNAAFENKMATAEDLKAFKVIDTITDASREELLDEFSTLLESHSFDSKTSTKYLKAERSNKLIMMIIGIIMITLGFAMIIMPAPPYFEMFTIFYFNQDDGVTLMDLISLVIVFAGIYVLVRSMYNKNHKSR